MSIRNHACITGLCEHPTRKVNGISVIARQRNVIARTCTHGDFENVDGDHFAKTA